MTRGRAFGGAMGYVVVLAILLSGLPARSLAGNPSRVPPAEEREGVLVIGKVSSKPTKHYWFLKPMADYVVDRMGDLGIIEARVLMARDNEQMVRFLREGRVDWVTETPFAAVVFVDQAGAEAVLRKWKKGVSEYHTIFVTRKAGPVRTLADLRGRTIAFQDPGSTSAFLVPAAELLAEGLELVLLESPRDVPPAGAVGYIFATEEINMTTLLHRGVVDALAFSNLDWEDLDATPAAFRKGFRIIHRTRSFPRAVELVRRDLAPRVKDRLVEVLLGAADDPGARAALRSYQKTSRFDPITPEIKARMEEIRAIQRRVQTRLR